MNDQNHDDLLREGIVDMIQLVYEQSKEKLQEIECPHCGPALKTLDFDRSNGRFKIDTCCPVGDKLVHEAIEQL